MDENCLTSSTIDQFIQHLSTPVFVVDKNFCLTSHSSGSKKLFPDLEKLAKIVNMKHLLNISIKDLSLLSGLKPGKQTTIKTLIKRNNNKLEDLEYIATSITAGSDDNSSILIEIITKPDNEQSKYRLKKLGEVTGRISNDLAPPLATLSTQCESFITVAGQKESVSSEDIVKRVRKLKSATDGIETTDQRLKVLSKRLSDGDGQAIDDLIKKDEQKDDDHSH